MFLVYIHGTGLAYFNDVCIPLSSIPGRGLCSAERGDIREPATSTKIGSRSFRLAAPDVWNSLPPHLHDTTISRQQFKNGLKIHLFKAAYKWHFLSELFEVATYLLTYFSSCKVSSILQSTCDAARSNVICTNTGCGRDETRQDNDVNNNEQTEALSRRTHSYERS